MIQGRTYLWKMKRYVEYRNTSKAAQNMLGKIHKLTFRNKCEKAITKGFLYKIL
jgi:hypothetical protein